MRAGPETASESSPGAAPSGGAVAPVGILGGTFDPVHHGHLRLALEMLERLGLAEVRLVPLERPAHRAPPRAAGALRLAMLEAAVASEPRLVADDRELKRGGVSYTVDTLTELREELGPAAPICLILGMDAFAGLPSWRAWTRIPQLAHLAVARRPGSRFPQDTELARLLDARRVEDAAALARAPAGSVLLESFPLLDISSSRIRELVAAGGNPRYLLPEAVLGIIRAQALYQPR